LNVTEIRKYILCDDFLQNYTSWTWDDELLDLPNVSQTKGFVDSTMDDRFEDTICDIGAESFV